MAAVPPEENQPNQFNFALELKKMLCRFALATFFAMVAVPLLNAEADIVMTINTTAKTFSFSGSDTGTPQDDGGGSESIAWEYLHGSIAGGPSDTTFSGFSPDAHWNFSNSIQVINDPGFETRLTISLASTSGPSGVITVTPNSTNYDYSSFGSDQMTILTDLIAEGSIPISFSNSGSSGFSAINVTAVPEPTSFALILGMAMFGMAHRRRSKNQFARK